MSANTPLELVVGHTYEAKRPRIGGYPAMVNDRQITWIGLDVVQYDGPTVGFGRHYPKITKEKFLAWAGRDVTAEMPPGEWRDQSVLRKSNGS